MNQNLKIALIIVVVIIVILVAVLVTASAVLGGFYEGWPWHMHDFMWPGMMRFSPGNIKGKVCPGRN